MDAGPVWAQRELDIAAEDTCATLQARLAEVGAPFLADVLDGIRANALKPVPQEERLATLAPAVRKEEGRIDWQLPAQRLLDQMRAFTPWPGLFFQSGGRQFRVTRARLDVPTGNDPPPPAGRNLGIDRIGLHVACGNATRLLVTEFQPAGKRPMAPFNYCLGNCLPETLS
jgi:methionyl-tRNA formyltransferase